MTRVRRAGDAGGPQSPLTHGAHEPNIHRSTDHTRLRPRRREIRAGDFAVPAREPAAGACPHFAQETTMSTVTPISREAREAAERAIKALRDLHEADPFVYASVLDSIRCSDFIDLPLSMRQTIHYVRLVAHEMKLRAVHESTGVDREITDAALARFRAEVH